MIGDQEAALWREATQSADALDVYLDWLLIHDPVRGELLRSRMQHNQLTDDERSQERQAWLKALGLEEVCSGVGCDPLPRSLSIDAESIASLEPVLDQLPFLHIALVFPQRYERITAAFASPAMAKIRALSFTARFYEEEENYQQASLITYFGDWVVEALCASPNITQLEVLWLSDEPRYDCAKLVAAAPFAALRELRVCEAPLGDDGVIAIASSPLIQTLRALRLDDSDIGDAGALALAHDTQLEELSIRGHRIGPAAAAALRAMPSMKRIDLEPNV
jgi:hypothetical protein